MNSLEQKFVDFEQKLESNVVAKIDAVISSFDERVNAIVLDCQNKIEALSERISTIENVNCVTRISALENLDLESALDQSSQDNITNRIFELERIQHLNDLIINGVIYESGENLREILSNIGKVINCPVDQSNIVRIFRINNNSGSIIAKFTSVAVKENFFVKYLKFKNLKNFDIGLNSHSRIFINESLARHCQFLLKLA